jgi:hypothetical protein
MQWEGFILGLSNGLTCVAYCAPVLLPYLLGEGKGVLWNALLTGQFLLGRLLGYMLFAVLAWAVGRSFTQGGGHQDLLIGTAYAVFSPFLIFYGFFRRGVSCPAASANELRHRFPALWPAILPIAAGFVTGLSFCPPFLLAFTGAVAQTALVQSLLFFFSFFLGTSLLFVLAPSVGVFRGFPALQIIGKMAAGLMGLYYLYSGIILLIGGLKRV